MTQTSFPVLAGNPPYYLAQCQSSAALSDQGMGLPSESRILSQQLAGLGTQNNYRYSDPPLTSANYRPRVCVDGYRRDLVGKEHPSDEILEVKGGEEEWT